MRKPHFFVEINPINMFSSVNVGKITSKSENYAQKKSSFFSFKGMKKDLVTFKVCLVIISPEKSCQNLLESLRILILIL